ncbi:hypothetical protein N7465_011213 [Penicillium sp. CMV-2018d]|nr:hypothetical protein N7465_011213 [Penicillium sp. CMV-2018d]
MASNPSSKPRAKKRPRLSNESSNEPAGSPVETNSPPCWNREVAAAAQSASKVYPTLDTAGNPMLNLCSARAQISMTYLPPVRDLDWRRGKRNLNAEHQIRAALGQRLGMVALPGQECVQCIQGLGPFESCVVFHQPDHTKPMFAGACMNCSYRTQSMCSFRSPHAPNWVTQWRLRANNVNLPLPAGNVAQVVGPISERSHIGVPFPVDEGSVPSSTSTRSKQHGPEYSTKWYKTPLDNISLAQDINGMIAVREDLREIRARVAYDIKKLSKFAGDGGSEEETLEDDKPNPFYDSDSEHGDDDTSSVHARSENDGSEVGSVDVGSLGVGSVDLNSDVVDDVDDVDDIDSDMNTSDIDE